jgi:hypothetical protein
MTFTYICQYVYTDPFVMIDFGNFGSKFTSGMPTTTSSYFMDINRYIYMFDLLG